MQVIDPDEAATPVPEDGDAVVTPMLTPHDRCDAGDIQEARVRVKMPDGGTLQFCKHHFEKHEIGLMAAGALVEQDDRAKLLVRPA